MVMPEILTQPRPKFVEVPRNQPETIKVPPHSLVWYMGVNKGSRRVNIARLEVERHGKREHSTRNFRRDLIVVYPNEVLHIKAVRMNYVTLLEFKDFYDNERNTKSHGEILYDDRHHKRQGKYEVFPGSEPAHLPNGLGTVQWVEEDSFTLPLPLEPSRPLAPTPAFVYTASAVGGK